MKIANIQDSLVTEGHPLARSVTDHINTMHDPIHDPAQKEFEVDLPMKVQQEITFIKASETKEGANIVHVRLEGMTDTFAHKTRDGGTSTILDF